MDKPYAATTIIANTCYSVRPRDNTTYTNKVGKMDKRAWKPLWTLDWMMNLLRKTTNPQTRAQKVLEAWPSTPSGQSLVLSIL